METLYMITWYITYFLFPHVFFPVLIAILIGYLFMVIRKKEYKKLSKAFERLMYLNLVGVLLIVSAFFNRIKYFHDWRGFEGPYIAYKSGFPFRFFEISATEICSSCDEATIDLLPFFLNVFIFTIIVLPLLNLLGKKLKLTKAKLVIAGIFLLLILLFLYAVFAL